MKTKIQEDLYANLELQIAMALDYNEWLSQEKQRTDALLDAHSTALRRLNGLMVQSPSGEENVDSGRGEELSDGLKWEDAPEWADSLATTLGRAGIRHYVWCNSFQYMYINTKDTYSFTNGKYTLNPDLLDILATRPERSYL